MPEAAPAQPKATGTGSRTIRSAKRARSSRACVSYGREDGVFFIPGPEAHPGGTRLQPVAYSAGRVVCASLHRAGLRLQRFQLADEQVDWHLPICPRRLEADRTRLDLQPGDLLSRRFSGASWSVGRRGRAAAGDVHRGVMLGRRLLGLGARHLPPYPLDHLSRLRRARRVWARHRYISPVSTLIRWFPDRPGMATGMAIMGFGGGAF